jgi:hypothetical protein
MYSVIVAVIAAASHVGRHDWSFGRHSETTQTAIDTQMGSFGQLDALEQQCAATHVAHDAADVPVPKISIAPAQVPPSPTSVALSVAAAPASLGGGAVPPPATGPPQETPVVGTQPGSCGGLGLDDEQARSAIPPARAAGQRRRSALGPEGAAPAPAPSWGTEEVCKAMALFSLGRVGEDCQARAVLMRANARCMAGVSVGSLDLPTAAHTS